MRKDFCRGVFRGRPPLARQVLPARVGENAQLSGQELPNPEPALAQEDVSAPRVVAARQLREVKPLLVGKSRPVVAPHGGLRGGRRLIEPAGLLEAVAT